MKPPDFDYIAASTLAEAASLLGEHEDEATILAGGQSLMPLLNLRMARPQLLVDLGNLSELRYIREDSGMMLIGAMTSKRELERSALARERQPLLHASTGFIGHPQIRNRGTVGGSMAQADPAAEYPAVAVALGAEFLAVGPAGERTIQAEDFFITYLTTALEPAEVLAEVRVPLLKERTGWGFQEVARRHGDFAMAGVAATLTLDGNGRCSDARVVPFGVGATPLRASGAEEIMRGESPSESLFTEVGRKAGAELEDPTSDIHAPADYRRHLVQVLTQRALVEAAARAGEAA